MSVFRNLWADSWGARLEYILHNSILTLLEIPNATLLMLPRLLTDEGYRQGITQQIKNPVVKNFWVEEYNRWKPDFRSGAISPVQNKVGAFLTNPLLRNILSQNKNRFDLGWMMDNKRIFLANLSKGKIGEDTANLLGGLLITQLHLAGMRRVNLPEQQRLDYYIYADEFQNFATESFASILSESRKYHINLTIAHQFIDQLSPKLQASIFGNVGSLITFRIGSKDAEVLKKEFAPYFNTEDLQTANRYEIHTKISIDGITSRPFYAQTLPPTQPTLTEGHKKKIIRTSRERYGRKKEEIERKIKKWLNKEV